MTEKEMMEHQESRDNQLNLAMKYVEKFNNLKSVVEHPIGNTDDNKVFYKWLQLGLGEIYKQIGSSLSLYHDEQQKVLQYWAEQRAYNANK